jgi:hypothetical protein
MVTLVQCFVALLVGVACAVPEPPPSRPTTTATEGSPPRSGPARGDAAPDLEEQEAAEQRASDRPEPPRASSADTLALGWRIAFPRGATDRLQMA